MKKKISISIEKSVLDKIQSRLKDGLFRNQSHLIEYATKNFLEERSK